MRKDYQFNKNYSRIEIKGVLRLLLLLVIFIAGSCDDSSDSTDPISSAEKPGIPAEIVLVAETASSVVLRWSAPSNTGKNPDGNEAVITGYVLEYSNNTGTWIALRDTGTGIKISNAIGTDTNATVMGLTGGTAYGFRVSAVNNAGTGLPSPVKIITTISLVEAPGMLGEITEGAKTASSVVLSWSTPSNTGKNPDGSKAVITGYTLEYSNNTGTWVALRDTGTGIKISNAIGTDTNATVIGLTGGTAYGFRVSAVNNAGTGLASPVKIITTTSLAELPGMPGDIALKTTTFNSIVLNWGAPTNTGKNPDGNKAVITGYVLEYSNNTGTWVALSDTGTGIKISNAIGTDTNATVIGFTGGTAYGFRVSAVNNTGTGGYSKPITVRTDWLMDISLTPDVVNLFVSDTVTVTAIFIPALAATNITWSISDTNVAVISNNGNNTITVTTVSNGTAVITAAAGGLTESIFVNVISSDPPSNLRQVSCDKTTEVDLAWEASLGATKYNIYRVENGNRALEASVTETTYTSTGLTANTYYRYEIEACAGSQCSTSSSLLIATASSSVNNLAAIINSRQIPNSLAAYDETAQLVFDIYSPNADVILRYVLPGGTGNKNGSSWANAADNLNTVLGNIRDASATRVYAVLLGPGMYKPGAEMGMKNNVAILGGVSLCNNIPVNAATVGITYLSGSGTHRIFNNTNINNTAHLYGVTITDGNSGNGLGGGGVMNYNSYSVFTRVVFSGNSASFGGGFYDTSGAATLREVTFVDNSGGRGGGAFFEYSSTVLDRVVFSNNRSDGNGGGIYSDAVEKTLRLNEVIFSKNSSGGNGGGMYNYDSPAILTKTIFSENSAAEGGGLYNRKSPYRLTGAVFTGNTASRRGGGMVNDYFGDTDTNPIVVNSIFWGNQAGNSDNQIDFSLSFTNTLNNNLNLSIYNSVVEGGMPPGYTSRTTNTNFNGGGFTSDGNKVFVTFSNIISVDPQLGPLTDNGGGIQTIAIPLGSSAVNQGIFVKRKNGDLYYSTDNVTWYDKMNLFNDNGTPVTLPQDGVIDLTATDMRGEPRNGRPDLGVYEVQPSP